MYQLMQGAHLIDETKDPIVYDESQYGWRVLNGLFAPDRIYVDVEREMNVVHTELPNDGGPSVII